MLSLLEHSWSQRRNSHGSMTLMVALAAIGIVAIFAIGLTVSFLMLSQKKSQNQSEELVLKLSTDLNKDNWIGNMNNLIGFSRELVYSTREDLNNITQKHPRLKPLAIQLMEESRRAAQFVNEERKALIVAELKSVNKSIQLINSPPKGSQKSVSLPLLNADTPVIVSVDAGYIDGVPSNVYLSDGVPGLRDYDVQTKYAKENGKVLNANIDARLPAPDDDLEFQIASLPAPAKGTISPPRLTANSVFRKIVSVQPNSESNYSKCNQLPSAIQIDSKMIVSSPAASDAATGAIKVKVSAAAAGATLSLP